jgi:hypothetical protein
VKTDGVDHHDDHFWPGPRDVAWDLAGAQVELGLGPEAMEFLVAAYAAHSGDASVTARLPLHRTAYLAYRMGYAAMAAEALAHQADGPRFTALRDAYSRGLRRELEALA